MQIQLETAVVDRTSGELHRIGRQVRHRNIAKQHLYVEKLARALRMNAAFDLREAELLDLAFEHELCGLRARSDKCRQLAV